MAQLFSIEALPAKQGDCLMVYLGTPERPRFALFDGGFVETFNGPLKSRLKDLRTRLGVADTDGLPLDLVTVSHMDHDHIAGILRMVEQEIEGRRYKPPFIDIKVFWLNSFETEMARLTTPDEADATGLAALADFSKSLHGAHSALASISQGIDLAKAVNVIGGIKRNHPFRDNHVMAGTAPHAIKLGSAEIIVLGPHQQQLSALMKDWDAYLVKLASKPSDEAALAAAKAIDDSITNLSSIVTLLKADTGESMLLTGDALGDHIVSGLKGAGLLTMNGTIEVDMLKMPHHGSTSSNTDDLLNTVLARHYVISGNGVHRNPERSMLEKLVSIRKGDRIDIHFTYPADIIDANCQKALKGNWRISEHSLTDWAEAYLHNDGPVQLRFPIQGQSALIELGPAKFAQIGQIGDA